MSQFGSIPVRFVFFERGGAVFVIVTGESGDRSTFLDLRSAGALTL